MTLQECYNAIGGNYEEVLGRLRSEALVKKFVLKFLDDPSYNNLCNAIETHDRESAFRAAHTIKGVCQNLSFSRLYASSHSLTEELRDEWGKNFSELFDNTVKDYEETAKAIREFAQSDAN